MNDFMDFRTVRLPCPVCGHITPKAIGWLKTHSEYTCDGCGETVSLGEDEVLRTVRKAQDAMQQKGL